MRIFIIRITKFISDLYLSSENVVVVLFFCFWDWCCCWWEFHLILSKIDYVSASNWFELLVPFFAQFLFSSFHRACEFKAFVFVYDGILLWHFLFFFITTIRYTFSLVTYWNRLKLIECQYYYIIRWEMKAECRENPIYGIRHWVIVATNKLRKCQYKLCCGVCDKILRRTRWQGRRTGGWIEAWVKERNQINQIHNIQQKYLVKWSSLRLSRQHELYKHQHQHRQQK